jgi:hypothetical protein
MTPASSSSLSRDDRTFDGMRGCPRCKSLNRLGPRSRSLTSTSAQRSPTSSKRNKALGIWGALGGIGATTAWLIGGPIVDGLGWEWIFFINIPVGLAALALSPLLLRESKVTTQKRSFDPAGALSITGALTLLVYAIVEAPNAGWGDPQTIGLLVGSAALLGAFALIESRHRAPLVPLGIFRRRTVVGANAVMLIFGTLPYGLGFVLTLYAQQVLDYSAVRFGLTSLVFPAMAAVGSIFGQAIVLRIGFRPVAAAGMALMGTERSSSPRSPRAAATSATSSSDCSYSGRASALPSSPHRSQPSPESPSASPDWPPGSATRASRSGPHSGSPWSRPWPSPEPRTTWRQTSEPTGWWL